MAAHALERWEHQFLEAGQRGLKTKLDPEDRELTLAKAKLGESMKRLKRADVLLEGRVAGTLAENQFVPKECALRQLRSGYAESSIAFAAGWEPFHLCLWTSRETSDDRRR